MARRSKAAARDPFADLADKLAILEREMAVQRKALERLKAMGRTPREERDVTVILPVRRTA